MGRYVLRHFIRYSVAYTLIGIFIYHLWTRGSSQISLLLPSPGKYVDHSKDCRNLDNPLAVAYTVILTSKQGD